MEKINKILVANRGEIALRILRSAREMGIGSVAVYSEADRMAPHVRFADEAICIGPPPASESYMRIEAILEACRISNADALHPGYGFMAENASFARKVIDNGIVFIGPSPDSIALMGDKLRAKAIAKSIGVPCIPGSESSIETLEEAMSMGDEIGYPVLLKASAGGGGKGMRIVRNREALGQEFERARSEAYSAFGDGAIFIEKYIDGPKHIEFQVLGDQHGHYIHLMERDCSVQRRYQKVIEEAPSAFLDHDLRTRMGDAAVSIAKACRYFNAGTVEFVVDRQRRFYFLEMNTRLQVEHPVTEMITGIDLVKEQIRIAQKEPLRLKQADIRPRGHAIELRVYAEDPENDFLPDTGILLDYRIPSGIGIRVDDGYDEGQAVTVHYDPLIAKLIAHGCDRKEAIERLKRAIGEYKIEGVKNTLFFGFQVIAHPQFMAGAFDTGFISRYYSEVDETPKIDEEAAVTGALLSAILFKEENDKKNPLISKNYLRSKWKDRSWH